MARKKLSLAQRAAIRKEILKKLGAGASRSSIARQLGGKYGVSTVTIRWYLKTLKRSGLDGRGRLPSLRFHGPGGSLRLLDIVKHVSEDGLARALAAKKLFLELQAKLEESERLRRTEVEIRKSRETLLASARKLEEKLHRLTVS
ncbi:MAG TPA: hypothetical protein VKW04_15900 [Planctomycetota bacterium]|nr:hypothetical protein [Planctomycetota bacterium]